MSETSILAARASAILNGIAPWKFDLALALGYEPESFDGMWKLTPDPFIIEADHILAEEVIYVEGTTSAVKLADNTVATRYVRHPIPAGWTTEPTYRAVPPHEDVHP